MSIEAPMGGISTGAAVSAGPAMGGSSFSSEIGSLQSFAAPSLGVDTNGGSFNPGFNMESLFAETTPLATSVSNAPAAPVLNSGSIFSTQEWGILGKAENSPKTDTLQNLGFEPFVAQPQFIAEKTIDLTEGEWVTLVKASPKSVVENIFPETVPVIPNGTSYEKLVDFDLGEMAIIARTPQETGAKEDAQMTETLKTDIAQAEKVTSLLIETGVYSKEQAAQRVAEIVGEVDELEIEEELEIKEGVVVDAGEEAQPTVMADEQAIKNKSKQTSAEAGVAPKPQELVLDKEAQEARRKGIKEKIIDRFKAAKNKTDSDPKTSPEPVGIESVADELSEESEYKSKLLYQMELPDVPDGSFDEDKKAIKGLGVIAEASEDEERRILDQVDKILDSNPPVEMSQAERSVSKEDVDKVLKFVHPKSLAA